MGSYNLVDFVTGLPIREFSKQTYVLVVTESTDAPYDKFNINYIDAQFKPVSFPLFGEYNGYGEFILNDTYQEENKLAVDYMKLNPRTSKKVLVNDNKVSDRELEDQELLLSAVHLGFYEEAIQNLPEDEDWDMVDGEIATYDKLLDKRIKRFGDWLTKAKVFAKERTELLEQRKIQSEEEKDGDFEEFVELMASRSIENKGQIIIRPNVRDAIQFPDIYDDLDLDFKSQEMLYQRVNDSIDLKEYIYNWLCFYNYLQDVGVPFRPIVTEPEGLDFKRYKNHYEMKLKTLEVLEDEYIGYFDENE